MRLREIMDWVEIQGEVHIKEFVDNDLITLVYTEDFEYEEISDYILELYVKYMYVASGILQIEVSKEY